MGAGNPPPASTVFEGLQQHTLIHAEGSSQQTPIKDLTKADGTVSVQDGQTIVLGGMIGNQTVTSQSKVPWLGDLPWVGRLFRHDVETISRKELLIFLTPTVLNSSMDSEDHDAHELSLVELPDRTRSEMLRLNSFYDQSTPGDLQGGMIENNASDLIRAPK